MLEGSLRYIKDISINNIFTFGLGVGSDCSCYSSCDVAYIAIVAPQSMASDKFYLQKCTHIKQISYFFTSILFNMFLLC